MSTLKRTLIILLAALIVAAGLLALGQTEWAAGAAEAVIEANQTTMTAQHNAYMAAGAQPTSGSALSTAGNLARMLVIAAAVVGGSVLLDRRARAGRITRS